MTTNLDNLKLIALTTTPKRVFVAAEINGEEVQGLQIEIDNNRLKVYHYTPGPDYQSREAELILDIGVEELLRSLEITDGQ